MTIARNSRVGFPQPLHLRGAISSNRVGMCRPESLDPELADGGLEDDDALLKCGDCPGVQAHLEVFFVDPVVKGSDVVAGHGGECSFPAFVNPPLPL